jgi:hypothetical protein
MDAAAAGSHIQSRAGMRMESVASPGKIIGFHGDPADHGRAAVELAAGELECVIPQRDLAWTQFLYLLPRRNSGWVAINRHAEGLAGGSGLEQRASGMEREHRSHVVASHCPFCNIRDQEGLNVFC